MDISRGLSCSLCANTALDLLGHHAVTCKKDGDVVTQHNRLRDVFVDFCHQAHLDVHVEIGNCCKTSTNLMNATAHALNA